MEPGGIGAAFPGGIVKDVLCFDLTSAPSLITGLCSGLCAYATNDPMVGASTTMWLRLGDGRILRIGVEMHDLSDWEEIGTLTFEIVGASDAPEMVSLPAAWSKVQKVYKLVYNSEECEAGCGFSLLTKNGDQLVVVPGADVYTLAIQASFYTKPFTLENDLAEYLRQSF